MLTIMNWLKELVALIKQKPATALLVMLFVVITLKVISLYASADMDEEQWQQFKAAHHCQPLVSETGVQRLGWQCDDGDVYYRWRQQR